MAIGAVQFSGQGARNDLTKAMADTAADGLVVVEDDGRILYANESYLALAGGDSFARSEARRALVRRRAGGLGGDLPARPGGARRAARRARRCGSRRRRRAGAISAGIASACGRSLAPDGRTATLWTVADVTHERERQENVFQELQHAIDYLDHAPAGFLSIDPDGAVVYMNATLAAWLDHDLAQVGSGGLRLADVVSPNIAAMMTSVAATPGDVRTETFDVDLRRRNGQPLPVRLYHRVAFGQDGRPGASRTLVLNRSPGEDVDEGQRAAEVRFARFFNATPIAIATVNRAGRVVRSNASFARLFGMLPRTGANGEGRSIVDDRRGARPRAHRRRARVASPRAGASSRRWIWRSPASRAARPGCG